MSIRSRMYFDDLQNGTTEDKLIAVGELILLAKKKNDPKLFEEIYSSPSFWKNIKDYIVALDADTREEKHHFYAQPLRIHKKISLDHALQFFTEMIENCENENTPLSVRDWTKMTELSCFDNIVALAQRKGLIKVEIKNLDLISKNKNNDEYIERSINNGFITLETLKKNKIETFNFLTNLAENQMTRSLFASLKNGLLTPDVTIFENGSDSLFHWTSMNKKLFLFNFNALCKGAITPDIAKLQDDTSKDTLWHIAMENDMNPMFIEKAMASGLITKEIISLKNADGVTLLDLFAQSKDSRLFEKAIELKLIPHKYLFEMATAKKKAKPQKTLTLKAAPKKIERAGHDSKKLGNRNGERQYRR